MLAKVDGNIAFIEKIGFCNEKRVILLHPLPTSASYQSKLIRDYKLRVQHASIQQYTQVCVKSASRRVRIARNILTTRISAPEMKSSQAILLDGPLLEIYESSPFL